MEARFVHHMRGACSQSMVRPAGPTLRAGAGRGSGSGRAGRVTTAANHGWAFSSRPIMFRRSGPRASRSTRLRRGIRSVSAGADALPLRSTAYGITATAINLVANREQSGPTGPVNGQPRPDHRHPSLSPVAFRLSSARIKRRCGRMHFWLCCSGRWLAAEVCCSCGFTRELARFEFERGTCPKELQRTPDSNLPPSGR